MEITTLLNAQTDFICNVCTPIDPIVNNLGKTSIPIDIGMAKWGGGAMYTTEELLLVPFALKIEETATK
jgi:hypothetical protein